MKTRIIAYLLIASATALLAACESKGPSEEVKNSMEAFETSWRTTGETLDNWEETMKTTIDGMDKMMDETMGKDRTKLKGDELASVDSMMMMCKPIESGIESMKTTYDQAKEQWKNTITIAGINPILTSVYPNCASGTANAKSQTVARPHPPAIAWPSILAITGFDNV